MNITIKDISEKDIATDALILPFFEDYQHEMYSEIDSLLDGMIKRVISSKEFTGRHNQLALLHIHGMINAKRVLLVGFGKHPEITSERIRQCGGKVFSYLRDIAAKEISVSTRIFNFLPKGFRGSEKPVSYLIEGGLLSLYRFEKYKKADDAKEIESATILSSDNDIPLKQLQITASAVSVAKDLINTPANDMTPTVLSDFANSLANEKIKVKTLQKDDIEKEGMGAYLAVSKGSAQPPKFIVVEYNGAESMPVAIIGKSITFDSGGISLKPAEGMEKMKYDMSGGAAVLAIIKAASEATLPVNIVGILPATENLPGGDATRPGDIVRTITGKTVEIVNTDAEGRLALADAIGYAVKHYKPSLVIDIATLTGACSIALGSEAIAMMGNDTAAMEKLKEASEETYERVWQMPLYDEYKEYLKSDAADMKNSGGKNGSLVTAGYFLKEFAGTAPWVHLDIAGTAWSDKDKPYATKGATGVGVRLILNFLSSATYSL
ncbi:MAG: leucyl aminopeptidase [Nitrospirae bacterium]|nr:leucyl aminopeptidase [Nitrospirota bacterium]